MTQANNPTGKAIAGFLGAVVVAVASAGGAYAYTTQYAHVATVNGERIAMGLFQRRLSGMKQQYAQQMGVNFHNEAGKAVLDDLHAKVLDRLVERVLIQQEAAKRGIVVNAETIDREFEQIVQASFGGDKQKLADRLRQLHMTEADAREQVADSQYAKGLMASIAGSDRMTEAQALDYYNKNRQLFERQTEVKAAHILVPTLEEAKTIQQELFAGADFAELAKKYSKDPGSAANGGDLGFFGKGQMVKPFEEAAFALKEKQVSEPVKTQFGYHLIRVEERRAGGLAPFEDVKDQIIEQNDRERHQEAFRKWLDEAKKKADVHYAAGYAPKVSAETRPPADDGHNH